jgi:hypothetical protein
MDEGSRRRAAGVQAAGRALAAREEYQARLAAREARHADDELAGLTAWERAHGERAAAAGAPRPGGFRGALPDAGLLARFASARTRFW